ncbi:hypothetical protein Vretimale_13673 [Volvox reticuliferus]|uniref:Uncharacterized protein n=1 Tax=Volvox reticuliferus TaxID=1737510 RepID=A0A8J4LT57_9CHLO|nr:hypothetical protein Vretimale_13673 [Volvox reticuliferus]
MSELQLKNDSAREVIRSSGAVTFPTFFRRPANVLLTLAEAKASSSSPTVMPKRARVNPREETGEESPDGTDEVEDEVEVFGNLKANLVWDCTGRRLCISARQYAESARKLELKMRGMLDTASGQHRVWGHIRRNFYTHVPLLQRLLTAQSQRQSGGWVDEPNLDPDALLPGEGALRLRTC